MYNVDSNNNVVLVSQPTQRTCDGLPLLVVRLLDNPSKGYIAACEPDGGFGTEECPSSYGRPCLSWFGEGERYPDAFSALSAVADSCVGAA